MRKLLRRLARRREQDRYALTELAEAFLEDPLETWYALDTDAAEAEPTLIIIEGGRAA